jgi:hypothetical protein
MLIKNEIVKRLKSYKLQLREIIKLASLQEVKNKKFFDVVKKILNKKIHGFHHVVNPLQTRRFCWADVLAKFGTDPKCYLTGRKLDYTESSNYNFDHMIPRSKGGSSGLDNLGLCCKEANYAKSDLLLPDFLKLCEDVLKNFGYRVEPPK